MACYYLRITQHYSGQMSGHFPDFPGLVVLGRDHQEVTELAQAALEQELARRLAESGEISQPLSHGRITVSTTRLG